MEILIKRQNKLKQKVSKEGAEALKATSVQIDKVSSNTTNRKVLEGLERTYMFHSDVKDDAITKFHNANEKYGIHAGTVVGQSLISHMQITDEVEHAIRVDLSRKGWREGTYKRALKHKNEALFCHILRYEELKTWLEDIYYPSMEAKFKTETMTARKASQVLDNFVNEQDYLSTSEKESYFNQVKEFQDKQAKMSFDNKEQKGLDLITFKTNCINYIVYQNKLSKIKTPDLSDYDQEPFLTELKAYKVIPPYSEEAIMDSIGY